MAGISLVFITILKRRQNTALLTESKQACHSRKLFLCTGSAGLPKAGSHCLRQGPGVLRGGRESSWRGEVYLRTAAAPAVGLLTGRHQLPAAERALPWEADGSASAWLVDML